MNVRIAVAQIDVRVGDLRHNLLRHIEYAEQARDKHADVVVFPELSLTGYSLRDLTGECSQRALAELSEFGTLQKLSHDIRVIAGGVEESDDFRLYNAAFLLDRGALTTVHRKIYLPTYGMFEENRYFLPGVSARTFGGPGGRWGTLICEDLWHISLPYVLAQDGAEIITGIAASPTRLGGDADGEPAVANVNLEHHKSYARLLSCYVIFCNRVGFEDGIGFWGGSSVVKPDGAVDQRAPFFDEDLLVADIERDEIRRARRDSRHALDEKPEIVLGELKRISRINGNAD
jgi:NAD+ synthase (glutamine-hydrolysing)